MLGRSQLGENGNLKENGGLVMVMKLDGDRGPLSVRSKGLGLQDVPSRGLGLRDISRPDVQAEVASGGPDGSKLSETVISRPGILSRGLRDTSCSGMRADVPLDDSDGDKDEDGDEDKLSESDIERVPPESDTESSSDLEDEEEALSDTDDDGEEEADLLAAERLLSRTLAIANSDPEQGMAAEIRKSFLAFSHTYNGLTTVAQARHKHTSSCVHRAASHTHRGSRARTSRAIWTLCSVRLMRQA